MKHSLIVRLNCRERYEKHQYRIRMAIDGSDTIRNRIKRRQELYAKEICPGSGPGSINVVLETPARACLRGVGLP